MSKNLNPAMILFISLLIFSCSASKNTTDNAQNSTNTQTENMKAPASYTYEGQIKAIIDEHCATKCHSAEWEAGGLNFTKYKNVKKEAVKGDLIASLEHQEGITPMPKKAPKLGQDTIQMIIDWVAAGAPQ